MYVLIRTISAISVILTFCILFLFIKKYFSQQNVNPWVAGVLLLSLPVILPNAKIAKPHTAGMMFVLLGTYFAYKIFDQDEIKNYILSGIFYGCAFSVLYTNFISIFILYFIELVKQNFRFSKVVNKKIVVATTIFVFIFLLTNWYIIVDFDKFLRRKKELEIIFNYGNFNFLQSIRFCKYFFVYNLPWYLLPIFVGGVYWILRNKETRLYPFLLFVFLHSLFVILYMKHENVFIISAPFVATVCVYGIYEFIKCRYYLIPSYSFIIIMYLIINFVFQNTLFSKDGNITLCGEWINKNVPLGASIGVKDGWFCVGDFPPIRVVDYKLVHIPSNTSLAVEDTLLPQYLVSVDNNIEQLPVFGSVKHKYKVIFYLPQRKFLLWRRNRSTPTENVEVKIYRKI